MPKPKMTDVQRLASANLAFVLSTMFDLGALPLILVGGTEDGKTIVMPCGPGMSREIIAVLLEKAGKLPAEEQAS